MAVHFDSSETFQPIAAQIVERVAIVVRSHAPGADVRDMGATSIPGLLTKGDVDVNARVAADVFSSLVEHLRRHFPVHQPQNWSAGYASSADEETYELPVGVQVTILGHRDDVYVAQRDRRAASPELIARYNELKIRYEGSDIDEYRVAKWEFIDTHLKD